MPIRSAAGMLPLGLLVLGAGAVSGQTYPNKPIRIVAAEPGGSPDFVVRTMLPGLSAGLGQQVIIDNRPTMSVLADIVTKATPDGYTLLITGSSFWLGPLLRKTPYDVARDFSPITMAIRSPTIVVVHPSVPVKSVKELIVLAKSKPGGLNYGSASIGSANHLGMELFKAMAGVDIVRVPYKGAGPALAAVAAGEVQLSFGTPGSAMTHVKSGRLRALAVTSAEPSALFPELPAVAATVPGYESVTMNGMFAPAGTPAAIINRLNQEMVRAINAAEVKERLFNAGVEPVGSSPEEFAAKIKLETTRLGKVIKEAGIRGE